MASALPPTMGSPSMPRPRKPKTPGSGGGAPYAVGYGKPPKAHQFKPDQSGNPRGESAKVRARKMDREGSAFDAMILDESARPVAITENGKRTEISTYQAMMRRATIDAVKGDRSAQKLIIPQVQAAHERRQAAALERFGLLAHYVTSQSIARSGSIPHDSPCWPHPDDVQLDYVRCIGEVVGPVDARQAEAFAALLDDHRLWKVRLAWLEDRIAQAEDDMRSFYRNVRDAIMGLLDKIRYCLPPSLQIQLDWEASEMTAEALHVDGLEGEPVNLALMPPEGGELAYGLYQLFTDARRLSAKVPARARLDIAANTTALVNRLRVERQAEDMGTAPTPAAPDFAQFYTGFAEDGHNSVDAGTP